MQAYTQRDAGDTNASPSPDICRGIAFGKGRHIHRGMREIQMRRHLRTFVEVLHLVNAGTYTEGAGDTNASPSPDICRGIAFGKCRHIHRGCGR